MKILALALVLASIASFGLHGDPAADPARPSPAEAAFERYKALDGRWRGESTEGWEAENTFRAIARGSVVMSTSQFEAHPGETMVSMIHLHEGRLLLTHYCVAGNQPRLEATSFSDDGTEVTFTYLDGTGLSSRDEGHMDSVVVTFGDDDSYTSRWSWYQDGVSSWMEDIRLERDPVK